ncbi:S24 family peptidase [Comamonas serinivorans]|nr:S24 family peptidase [Comamonas serinivorans]
MFSGPPQAIDLDNNPDYPAVRRVKFKLSAGASGYGIEYLDEEAQPIVFRKDWFSANGYRAEKLLAVRIANGSMEPGLYDGDIVVVNTEQDQPKDGAVFAANYEGEMVIKRLQRDAGEWWLCSDNPDQRRYPRKVCHEGVFLLGQIVYKQSSHI